MSKYSFQCIHSSLFKVNQNADRRDSRSQFDHFAVNPLIGSLCFVLMSTYVNGIERLSIEACIVNTCRNISGATLNVLSMNQCGYCCNSCKFAAVPNMNILIVSWSPESRRIKFPEPSKCPEEQCREPIGLLIKPANLALGKLDAGLMCEVCTLTMLKAQPAHCTVCWSRVFAGALLSKIN
jgi:hypothetical protein